MTNSFIEISINETSGKPYTIPVIPVKIYNPYENMTEATSTETESSKQESLKSPIKKQPIFQPFFNGPKQEFKFIPNKAMYELNNHHFMPLYCGHKYCGVNFKDLGFKFIICKKVEDKTFKRKCGFHMYYDNFKGYDDYFVFLTNNNEYITEIKNINNRIQYRNMFEFCCVYEHKGIKYVITITLGFLMYLNMYQIISEDDVSEDDIINFLIYIKS